MDISIWTQRHFYENSEIQWNCPTCNAKSLEFVKDKLITEETIESKKIRKTDDSWEVEWIELNVNGTIKCKNCDEFIFFIGKGNPVQNGYYDYELDDFVEEYNTSFTPIFINPTIHIFPISKNCPESVQEVIIDSFRFFWCDLESCVNKIRVSIELLLNEQKVKKFEIIGGKRRPISLHKRIQLFGNNDVKDLLTAIKWIGNTGSHNSSDLETIDVIETYKLLEFSLKKLYENEEKEIKKITDEIIKRKGTRKR